MAALIFGAASWRQPGSACLTAIVARRDDVSAIARASAAAATGRHRLLSDASIEENHELPPARVRRRRGRALPRLMPRSLEQSGIIRVDKPAEPSAFATFPCPLAYRTRWALRELLP